MFARISESMALGYYHSQKEFPVVQYLLSDDAPEYKKIAAQQQGLCWIHDNRHYKKLVPKIQVHHDILEQIQKEYWTFYGQLLDYKEATKQQQILQKPILTAEFERIFSQHTERMLLCLLCRPPLDLMSLFWNILKIVSVNDMI